MKGKIFFALFIVVLAYSASRFANDKSMKFHRWKLVNKYLPEYGEFLGLGSKQNISRKLIELQYSGKFHGNKKVKVSERQFGGTRSIIYQPIAAGEEARPAIIFIHGGGWVKGVPESFNEIALEIVQRLEVAVISFDYRKAPDRPFPAGLNDCLRGIIALSGESKSLNINPFRLAIMGESTGGNLAAGVAGEIATMQELRDKLSVKLLILFNPVLQAMDFNLPSFKAHGDQFMMTRESLMDYWLLYITGKTSADLRASLLAGEHLDKKAHDQSRDIIYHHINKNKKKAEKLKQPKLNSNSEMVKLMKASISDPRASPLLISSDFLDMLPPVYLVTCEFDITKDEALIWRDHLQSSRVRVYHHHYSFYHSILSYYSDQQRESVAAVNDFIGHILRNALL